MSALLEAARQALEALEQFSDISDFTPASAVHAITALRQAIEQAERPTTHSDECWRWHHACAIARIKRAEQQEPVALDGWVLREVLFDNGEPLGHRKPQRKPLTDETLWEMWVESPSDVLRFARAIERAHGIGGGK